MCMLKRKVPKQIFQLPVSMFYCIIKWEKNQFARQRHELRFQSKVNYFSRTPKIN